MIVMDLEKFFFTLFLNETNLKKKRKNSKNWNISVKKKSSFVVEKLYKRHTKNIF